MVFNGLQGQIVGARQGKTGKLPKKTTPAAFLSTYGLAAPGLGEVPVASGDAWGVTSLWLAGAVGELCKEGACRVGLGDGVAV